jgi:HSP20 family protein
MVERWEPFKGIHRQTNLFDELVRMQQEMNSFFDDFFGERRSDLLEGNWLPALDVSETEKEIIVRVELPGMTQQDIDLSLHENMLLLKGEKKPAPTKSQENYHRAERSYGSFNRSLTLPANVDPNQVQATFKDGVLQITLSKVAEVKPQKISITGK